MRPDLRDLLENGVCKELAVQQVPKVHEEQPDWKAWRERVDPKDLGDRKELVVLPVLKDLRVLWEPRVQQVPWERQV